MSTPDIFKEKKFINEGTFGKVYQAKIGDKIYALKKIKVVDTEFGFPITSFREIKMLKKLEAHPNIVQLVDIVRSKSQTVYLVFEYVEFDLKKVFEQRDLIVFSKLQLKYLMRQVMEGLAFMHRKRIIHRDVKSENILVSASAELKFADFGLARDLLPAVMNPSYTRTVCTPYYRPPEVCLKDPHYDEKVDIWSTGCVFAEFFCRMPLFRGTSELD